MRRSYISFARQKKRILTAHKPIDQPEKTKKKKKQFPLIRPTVSPWVFSSGDIEESEGDYFSGSSINQAARYFEIHGPRSKFVPPSEFSYEVIGYI